MYRPLLSQEEGIFEEEEEEEEGEEEEEDDDDEVVVWSMESTKLLGDGKKTYHEDPALQKEEGKKQLEYPRSVFFIIGNEFCERFSYYGMKAILTLYLHHQLMFSEDNSTVIYHFWAMLCYFTPILGAALADTVLGRYRTILYVSMVYVAGNAVLSLAAMPPFFPDLTAKIVISLLGLLLIALGTGGIKPCVSAFGGDQFQLPQQEKLLTGFFSMFYFSINAGSLLSTFATPILRADVQCFSQDCYPLAFAVPAFLMLVALVLFLAGSRFYTKKPPEGSVIVQFVSYTMATMKRMCCRRARRGLDSNPTLSPDIKRLLRLLLLFLPLPFFWALFDQQGSRWTFQATRMNGQLGNWDIKPDQMQVVNPLFILLLIPVFEKWLYPYLEGRGWLTRPLSRMLVGGILAGVAFLISAVVELRLELTHPVEVKPGEARVTLINTLPCEVTLAAPWLPHNTSLTSFQQKVVESVDLNGTTSMTVDITLDLDTQSCGQVLYTLPSSTITLIHKQAHLVLVTTDTSVAKLVDIHPPDDYHKSESGRPKLRLVYNLPLLYLNRCVVVTGVGGTYNFCIEETPQGLISGTAFKELHVGRYHVLLPRMGEADAEAQEIGQVEVLSGGVYNLVVQKPLSITTNTTVMRQYEVTPPNSVHMLWLVPQYLIITISEVMFSITGLQFSFTQAPSNMKSVVQAAWLLTVSFGNLIVVIIAGARLFERQALEFFLFAVLMFVDMMVFAVLASRYKYVGEDEASDHQNNMPGSDNEALSSDETKF